MTLSAHGRARSRWILTVSALILVLITLLFGGFFYAGHLIVADTTPRAADVGVILAGSFPRAMYAADLYHQGLIPRVWITKPEREQVLVNLDKLGIAYPRQEEISRAVLIKKGVPEDRIELIGDRVVSTIGEARLVAGLLEQRPDLRSVLIVTSRFHVRRAEAVFRYVLRSVPQATICVVGSPYDGFVADRWWTDRESAREVVLETAKLLLFWVGTEF